MAAWGGIGGGSLAEGRCALVTPHLTESLAAIVDVVLFAAALAVLVRWRSRLAFVTWLVAADPLWARLVQAAFGRSLPAAPTLQALYTVATDAPLWAAFVIGLGTMFVAAGRRGSV